jgi:GYF domain 2
MEIYVYKDGERVGPHSKESLTAWLAAGTFQQSDLAWREGFTSWRPLSLVLGAAKCPQCQGTLSLQTDNPQQGTGCIVAVLGFLFAPVCIGIPILILGIIMMSNTTSHWHCRDCGRTFPVD